MYVPEGRFDSPLPLEGYHARRNNDLEDEPVAGVGHVGAGMVTIVSYHPEHGVTYEQTEPIGDKWHRYTSRHTPETLVRPG
jgi:hypothetical protein